jgi:hypothetical protein
MSVPSKINIYVEKAPFQIERAFSVAHNLEQGDGDQVDLFWDRETAVLALSLIASQLGVEVIIDGKKVEIEL